MNIRRSTKCMRSVSATDTVSWGELLCTILTVKPYAYCILHYRNHGVSRHQWSDFDRHRFQSDGITLKRTPVNEYSSFDIVIQEAMAFNVIQSADQTTALFQRRGGVPRELPRGPTSASRSVSLLVRDDWRRGSRVEQAPHQEVYAPPPPNSFMYTPPSVVVLWLF